MAYSFQRCVTFGILPWTVAYLDRQVYVDALGTTTTYESYLSSLFPGIDFTVTTKADSKFKIVGAAKVLPPKLPAMPVLMAGFLKKVIHLILNPPGALSLVVGIHLVRCGFAY